MSPSRSPARCWTTIRNPGAEFEAKLASDPAFAANPAARLEFFGRRHESWDERYNLYPIFRTEEVLA